MTTLPTGFLHAVFESFGLTASVLARTWAHETKCGS